MNYNLYQEKQATAQRVAKYLSVDDKFAEQLNIAPGMPVPLIPTTHYVTAKITGTAIKFVESSKNKVIGVQSFDGNKLDANKPFIICGITGMYAKEAQGDKKTVQTANYNKAAPASLLNGELKLKQNNRGVVAEIITNHLFNVNTTNHNLDKEFPLADMPLVKDKSPFEIEVEIPEVLATGTDHFVKLELRGYTILAS